MICAGSFSDDHAEVAKLADAQDLKSCEPKGSCGFDPHPRHHKHWVDSFGDSTE